MSSATAGHFDITMFRRSKVTRPGCYYSRSARPIDRRARARAARYPRGRPTFVTWNVIKTSLTREKSGEMTERLITAVPPRIEIFSITRSSSLSRVRRAHMHKDIRREYRRRAARNAYIRYIKNLHLVPAHTRGTLCIRERLLSLVRVSSSRRVARDTRVTEGTVHGARNARCGRARAYARARTRVPGYPTVRERLI